MTTPSTDAHAQVPRDWHALTADDVVAAWSVDPERGLEPDDVSARRARFGPNGLPAPPRRGPVVRFLLQFHNPLIYVLLGAASVTAALDDHLDAGVILGVVIINAIVGVIQEGRVVFDNIKKSLMFMLPTNGGEAGVILLAVFAGLTLPVTPAQIL